MPSSARLRWLPLPVRQAQLAAHSPTGPASAQRRCLDAFAWRLPLSMKLRDGRGKHVLREVLYRHVPAALVDRPKMGFGVPVDEWLRGPLRDWAEALIDPVRLTREGYLRAAPVRQKWDEHMTGKRNWSYWFG